MIPVVTDASCVAIEKVEAVSSRALCIIVPPACRNACGKFPCRQFLNSLARSATPRRTERSRGQRAEPLYAAYSKADTSIRTIAPVRHSVPLEDAFTHRTTALITHEHQTLCRGNRRLTRTPPFVFARSPVTRGLRPQDQEPRTRSKQTHTPARCNGLAHRSIRHFGPTVFPARCAARSTHSNRLNLRVESLRDKCVVENVTAS